MTCTSRAEYTPICELRQGTELGHKAMFVPEVLQFRKEERGRLNQRLSLDGLCAYRSGGGHTQSSPGHHAQRVIRTSQYNTQGREKQHTDEKHAYQIADNHDRKRTLRVRPIVRKRRWEQA